MAWLIRPALRDDAKAILDIANTAIRDTAVTFNSTLRTLDEVAAWAAAPEPCLVVDRAGQVAGFLRMTAFRSGPGYARCVEHTIMLHDSLRGQGAGRALIEQAARQARAMGKAHMIACISGENAGGLAFHRAMGFVPAGLLPGVGFKFGREMDLHIYQKRL